MDGINRETLNKREKALAAYDRISDDDDDDEDELFITRYYRPLQKKACVNPPSQQSYLKPASQWKTSKTSLSVFKENDSSDVEEIPVKKKETGLRQQTHHQPIMARKPLSRSAGQNTPPTTSTKLTHSKLCSLKKSNKEEPNDRILSHTSKKIPANREACWPRNILGKSNYSNVNKRYAPLSSQRKSSTLDETFRMEEKKQYQQLLDQCSLKQSQSPRLSSPPSVIHSSPASSVHFSPFESDVRWSRGSSPQSNKSESEFENGLPLSIGCNRFFGGTCKSVNKEYTKDHKKHSNHHATFRKQTPLSDIILEKEFKNKNTVTAPFKAVKSIFEDEDVFIDLPKLTYSKRKESSPIPVVDLCDTDSDNTLHSFFKDSDSESVEVVDQFYREGRDASPFEDLFCPKKLTDNKLSPSKKPVGKVESINISDENVMSKKITQLDLLNDKLEVRVQRLGAAYASTPKCRLGESFSKSSLPPLTPEMQDQVEAVLAPYPKSEVVAQRFNISITRRDIATLKGLNWLNDEIINFYMNLIMERNTNSKSLPKTYVFSTFFYPKLYNNGHKSVSRWTKKVDIFSYDILLLPIHLNFHWCLATVDFKKRCISYYDSMLGDNDACLQTLSDYLKAEHLEKKNTSYSTKTWKLQNMKNIPEQMNGSDCGVFSCQYAEYTSRSTPIDFKQEDMPYFRRRMVYEIVNGKLLWNSRRENLL